MDPKIHANAYWRTFDNWADQGQQTDDVQDAEDIVMNSTFPKWLAYAMQTGPLADWTAAIEQPDANDAYRLLSGKQRETVTEFYGTIDEVALFNAYKWFGMDTLPPDPERPSRPRHRMDGRSMWFIWSSFADACLRSTKPIDGDFWNIESRAILIGLLHDGLFRGRFTVTGFEATDQGSANIISFAQNLAADELLPELAKRAKESGLF